MRTREASIAVDVRDRLGYAGVSRSMSSIAAILTTDDSPVDLAALGQLACPPFAPGSRPRASWIDGGVGLAAVALHPDDQPYAQHEGVHVVFDGRLDERASIEARLGVPARQRPPKGDADLVARAYRAWGAACIDHLQGDFSLCLWDAAHKVLWAARDRFGVKPLFYALTPGAIVVCNGFVSLRRDSRLSARLRDDAIGDFLLFGELQDPASTCFADVARLPAAHTLTCAPRGIPDVRRYWRLEMPEPLRYRDPRQYVEHYRDTLSAAVRERATGPAVSVFMSGGLDSSTVAALATAVVEPAGCLALTAVYDRVLPDQERHYSDVAARGIGIGIHHLPVDDYQLFDRWGSDARPPEPTSEPLTAITLDLLSRAGCHAAVGLTGDGGDPSLLPGAVIRQLGHVPIWSLMRDIWSTARRGVMPPLGIKSGIMRRLAPDSPPMPSWLSSRLRSTYDPEPRWKAHLVSLRSGRPGRTEAHESVSVLTWPSAFESADPTITGVPVELRYPFFDERVIALGLALPSYPWCVQKTILRDSMAGRLPPAILARPKSPMAGDALGVRAWPLDRLLATVEGAEGLDAFVDPVAFRRAMSADGSPWFNRSGALETACLAAWMRVEAGLEPVA